MNPNDELVHRVMQVFQDHEAATALNTAAWIITNRPGDIFADGWIDLGPSVAEWLDTAREKVRKGEPLNDSDEAAITFAQKIRGA